MSWRSRADSSSCGGRRRDDGGRMPTNGRAMPATTDDLRTFPHYIIITYPSPTDDPHTFPRHPIVAHPSPPTDDLRTFPRHPVVAHPSPIPCRGGHCPPADEISSGIPSVLCIVVEHIHSFPPKNGRAMPAPTDGVKILPRCHAREMFLSVTLSRSRDIPQRPCR